MAMLILYAMAKRFNPVDPANRIKMSLLHREVKPMLKGLLFSNHNGRLKRVPAPKYARKYDKECWISEDTSHMSHSQIHVSGILFRDGKSRKMLATRLAWFVAYNKDPGSYYVCHRCDRPKCRNPKHLFLGTMQDNMLDRDAKGRGRAYGKIYVNAHPVIRNLKMALARSIYRLNPDLSIYRYCKLLSTNHDLVAKALKGLR